MDYLPHSSDGFEERLAAVAVAVSVILLAFTLGPILSMPIFWAANQATGFVSGLLSLGTTAVCFVVMAAVGYIYLHITERRVAYLDLRKPTRRTIAFVGLGMAFSACLTIGWMVVSSSLEVSITGGWAIDVLGDDPVLLGLMVGMIVLVNAPIEEFLFRNIAQKRLGEVFTPASAILITSALFTTLHIQSCWVADPTLLSLGLPLTVVFVGSVGFGWLYEHTGDLSVPIGAHAFYNLLQFGVVFFSLGG